MRFKRTLLLALVATVSLAMWAGLAVAVASAAPQPTQTPSWWQSRADEVASAYWGITPDKLAPVVWRDEKEEPLFALDSANRACDYCVIAGLSEGIGGNVYLNASYPWDWATYCTTRIHEQGHALGHGHTDPATSKTDVMLALTPTSKACAHRGRSFLFRSLKRTGGRKAPHRFVVAVNAKRAIR